MSWFADELSGPNCYNCSRVFAREQDAIKKNKQLQDEAQRAYQRGAEAMREAAANYLEEDAKFESVAMSTAAEIYAGIIRRLPTPEDK